jgi:hypothetical protein
MHARRYAWALFDAALALEPGNAAAAKGKAAAARASGAAAAERAIHADAARRGARAPLPVAHSWPDHDTAAEALLVGPASYCSSRRRMPFNSVNEGSTCVSMTRRADDGQALAAGCGGGVAAQPRPGGRQSRHRGMAWQILPATSSCHEHAC